MSSILFFHLQMLLANSPDSVVNPSNQINPFQNGTEDIQDWVTQVEDKTTSININELVF